MLDHLSALTLLEKRSSKLRSNLLKHKAARRFFDRTTLIAHDLRQKSSRLLAGAGLTGVLLIAPVTASHIAPTISAQQAPVVSPSERLLQLLPSITPHTPTKLEPDQAKPIEDAIFQATGIRSKAVLEGQQLNHQIGYVGYEQHLYRYPGDTILDHDDEQIAGIAPGLGAWGYFAKNSATFTTQDYQREKWYAVAQTLYLPNWQQDFTRLRDWYKYRKVLLVNPNNGKAVVANIADAGPAKWTGKQFGASPEAMKALNLHLKSRKGLIIFLFLDDPDNKIPLGPVTKKYNT